MNKRYAIPVFLILSFSILIFFFPKLKYAIIGHVIFFVVVFFSMKINMYLIKKLEPIYREVFPRTNMDIDFWVAVLFYFTWVSVIGYLIYNSNLNSVLNDVIGSYVV